MLFIIAAVAAVLIVDAVILAAVATVRAVILAAVAATIVIHVRVNAIDLCNPTPASAYITCKYYFISAISAYLSV